MTANKKNVLPIFSSTKEKFCQICRLAQGIKEHGTQSLPTPLAMQRQKMFSVICHKKAIFCHNTFLSCPYPLRIFPEKKNESGLMYLLMFSSRHTGWMVCTVLHTCRAQDKGTDETVPAHIPCHQDGSPTDSLYTGKLPQGKRVRTYPFRPAKGRPQHCEVCHVQDTGRLLFRYRTD